MNKVEWLNQYVLRNYFSVSDFSLYDNTYEYFEVDQAEWRFYFPTQFQGKIVYRDTHGKQHYSKSISIQVTEDKTEKSPIDDFHILNEMCVQTRIVPFFSTLSNSIYSIVPKLLYTSVAIRNDDQDAALIMESLEEEGFRKLLSKCIFLDLQHLQILMKKVAEFHAFSYRAKRTQSEIFYSQIRYLKPAEKWIQPDDCFVYRKLLTDHFLPLLSKTDRYTKKLINIRAVLEEPKYILEMCFSPEANSSVLNVGCVYEPCLLFKYDVGNVPTDVKFSFLKYCKYCTPVLDIGYVLYFLANQSIRDRYWDHLLDVYYTSLRNSVAESQMIPEKQTLLNDFKRVSLFMFLFSILCMPYYMERAENPNLNWYPMLYTREQEEYKYSNWFDLPVRMRIVTIDKLLKRNRNRSEQILDILRDIMDRDFV